MLSSKQLTYLIEDVISLNQIIKYKFNIEKSFFSILVNKKIYKEPIFDFSNPELNEQNIKDLDLLLFSVKNDNYELGKYYQSNILKLTTFFINEHYLKKNIELDKHDRILSNQIQDQFIKYLEIPIVDILINEFKYYFEIEIKNEIVVYFTSDFDMTNLWSAIGLKSSIKRLLKQFIHFKFHNFYTETLSFLLSKYSTKRNLLLSQEMFDLTNKSNFKNIAFWRVHLNNKICKSITNFNNPSIKNFINVLKKNNIEFGLHPSYGSSENKNLLNLQKQIFSKLFKFNANNYRFHYLKYNYPEDLLNLEQEKDMLDFSYCFPDSLLFRGGRSIAIKAWSKKENRSINVISIPISIMDGTLNNYLNLDFIEAQKKVEQKIRMIKIYGNNLVLLWHNNNMYKNYFPQNYFPQLLKVIKEELESCW